MKYAIFGQEYYILSTTMGWQCSHQTGANSGATLEDGVHQQQF